LVFRTKVAVKAKTRLVLILSWNSKGVKNIVQKVMLTISMCALYSFPTFVPLGKRENPFIARCYDCCVFLEQMDIIHCKKGGTQIGGLGPNGNLRHGNN
jgi:hypothetical protein